MRLAVVALLALAPGVAAAQAVTPPAGASLPTAEGALTFATGWRDAVGAQDCARSKQDHEVHCKGEALAALMPPPVWAGVDVSDPDHLHESCEPWGRGKKLSRVDAGAAHDQLRACVAVMMEPRMTELIAVAPFAKLASRLRGPAREQLRALDKTHRFVHVTHKATSEDPDRFDLVLAVTTASGKPRLTALFTRLQVHSMDGE